MPVKLSVKWFMLQNVHERETKEVLLMGLCDSVPPYLALPVFVCN